MARFVVGVSGASGMILALRSIQTICEAGHDVDLVASNHAIYAATLELGKEFSSPVKWLAYFPEAIRSKITLHPIQDVGSAIGSGSHKTDGMLLIPCSMATLAAIACGLADSGLRRAADVALKERRKLVIVPRESPLSEIHLENMLKLTRLGAIIVPPVPAWYTLPKTLEDIENFIVGKALDALGVEHTLYPRWKGPQTKGC